MSIRNEAHSYTRISICIFVIYTSASLTQIESGYASGERVIVLVMQRTSFPSINGRKSFLVVTNLYLSLIEEGEGLKSLLQLS